MSGAADAEALRAVVREVLADLLPSLIAGAGAAPGTGQGTAHAPGTGSGHPVDPPATCPAPSAIHPAPPPAYCAPPQAGVLGFTVRERAPAVVETVSLRSDADLMAFVRRLLHLFENPRQREALRTGRLAFRLAAATGPGSVQPSHRVEKGAVTEAVVTAAARAGARLVLGRGAVLTPLARDRARAAGVEIERER